MDGFEGPVEDSHGTWSVGDRVGRTPRWTTYRGTDEEGDPIAIRTPTGTVPEDRHDRFDALARQWGTVDERRTVRGLLDWGTDPEPWVAVEYVPDELEAWATGATLETARACDPRTRAELLFDVCEVLRTYSRYGSTPCHLALHPDCLSFRVDGEGPVAVVDDWGLSRLVEDPTPTPYTAPEQLEGDHASKRTDVYRIGALAAAVLGNGSPFPDVDADDPGALAAAIREGIDVDALADDLPEGAIRPTRRATATDPADRYATTYPLGRDLLDAVPPVDTADRRADALAATVVPTPESSAAESGSGESEPGSAGSERGSAETGTATKDEEDASTTDASTAAAATTDASDPGGKSAGGDADGSDGGGSRRSFLKYGVGAFTLAGVGLGGLVAMDRNDPTAEPLQGGTTSTDGSGDGTGTETQSEGGETDSEEDAATEITGGTVTVDVGAFQALEGLPGAIADSDVSDEIDVETRSSEGGPERLEEFLSRVDAGDPTPDVMLVSNSELGLLASADATEPLSAHADDHPIGEVLGEAFPALEAMGRHPGDGEVHALPYAFMPDAILYRKPAFEEAGYQGLDDWMTSPPTWTEWSRAVANARRDRGFVWSGQPNILAMTFTGVLAGFGGAYYGTEDRAPGDDAPVTVDESPGIRAANVLHDLAIGGDRTDGAIERISPREVFEYYYAEPREQFLDGHAIAAKLPLAMAMEGIRQEDDAIGMMPLPAGSARSRTTVYGQYAVVNPNTELLGEALAVVRGLRSPTVASLVFENGWFPTMNGDPFSVDAVASSPYEPHAPAIRFMAENAVLEPATETWYHERSGVGEAIYRAITDDPDAGLREAASILDGN
ncbi:MULTISPECIES: extracellular solute-binding protein [Haloferacaceae]|uniref:Extracellular solute-binding protein n=1 Tax=Halorubrum glutamatedens TaxID=2707018 RepID=A0ABD5QLZ7_9EURY|nr:extracellular solute-binding protein [Halobellus captivus]